MQLFTVLCALDDYAEPNTMLQFVVIPRIGDKITSPNTNDYVKVSDVALEENPAPGAPVAVIWCESI